MTLAKPRITEDEFMRLPEDGNKYELIDGEAILVSPANFEHDALVMHLGVLLSPFTKGRGYLTGSQAGFRMKGGNIRCPDLGFTRKERLPGGKPVKDFADLAPDLCVEVISISEQPGEITKKVQEYFEAGAKQVWHLFPQPQRLLLYTSPTQSVTLNADDEVDGGDLLSGFRCKVADLFELD